MKVAKGHLEPTPEVEDVVNAFLAKRAALSAAFEVGGITGGFAMAEALTDATDLYLCSLWEIASEGRSDISMLALGGYGRRELSLGSDLDVVVEIGEGEHTGAELRESVERFVAWARLPRVKLAHAVRTPSQTAGAFDEDFRTPVSYLDARVLIGKPFVTQANAIEKLRGEDEGCSFVELLLEGYRARLDRFGQTIYLLEPDVKSGKGGLRDLHVIRWAGLVRMQVDVSKESSEALGWTVREAAAYREGHDWLLEVRGLLHAIRGRKHDRLLFPDQEQLAELRWSGAPRTGEELVEETSSVAKAAEALMRRHYQVTRTIAKLTERSLRRWGAQEGATEQSIDGVYKLAGGTLALAMEDVTPGHVFEALRLASDHDVLLDPVAEERIEAAAAEWGPAVVSDIECGRALCELLTDPDASSRTSRRLVELGILTSFVPEFEPVLSHVQHDVYHVYTTDVHLLHCLEFARTLLRGEGPGATKWPAFAQIAAQIKDRRVFLLAAFFHDIGKNRGGGHSEKGAAMMNDVGPRLGLTARQTGLLSFLVREHLALSHASRRHDITDRRVIRDLAARIRTSEALHQLTALTFCDMSNVGPTVMNDWNASLLTQLHERLLAAIEHGVEGAWRLIEADVAEIRDWMIEHVAPDRWTRSRVDAFIRDLPAAHLVESTLESLLLQFHAYCEVTPGEPTILIRPEPESGSTEIVVSSPDIPGALAQITGAISSLGLNILDARIVTTASGRLLDIFRVAQSGGASHAMNASVQEAVTDEHRLERLRDRMRDVLMGRDSVEELLRRRIAERRLAPRATPEVETSVEVLPDMSDDYTVLQVKAPDRIGLLYEIADTLSHYAIDIRLSKIDSVGTQVVDTFYVEALDGSKLDQAAQQRICAALLESIENSKL